MFSLPSPKQTWRAVRAASDNNLGLVAAGVAFYAFLAFVPLLAALVLAWRSETGQAQLLVDVEGHGRQVEGDELDLSRTAGWFTAVYPVLLEAVSGEAPESTLTAVRRRLEEVPDGGIGYGILRYLHPAAAERLAELPVAQVLFNYLGQTDGALEQAEGWKWVEADTGEERSRRDGRDHLLEINAAVRQGCLEVDWIYSESVHQRAVVEQLAVSHLRCAEALIGSGRRPDTPAEGEAKIAGDLLADGSIEEGGGVDTSTQKECDVVKARERYKRWTRKGF